MKDTTLNEGMKTLKIPNAPKPRLKNDEMINSPFKLQDLDESERFNVWDNNERMFINIGDELVSKADGQVYILEEKMKFITKDDWEEHFPNTRKVTSHERNVVLNGFENMFGFKPSQNKILREKIKTIEQLGQNPLDTTFIMTRTGSGLDTRYDVVIATKEQAEGYVDVKEEMGEDAAESIVLNENASEDDPFATK